MFLLFEFYDSSEPASAGSQRKRWSNFGSSSQYISLCPCVVGTQTKFSQVPRVINCACTVVEIFIELGHAIFGNNWRQTVHTLHLLTCAHLNNEWALTSRKKIAAKSQTFTLLYIRSSPLRTLWSGKPLWIKLWPALRVQTSVSRTDRSSCVWPSFINSCLWWENLSSRPHRLSNGTSTQGCILSASQATGHI